MSCSLACEQHLEDAVGKWTAGVYTTNGRTTSWIKVKNASYRQAERRGEFFEGRGGARLPRTP